MKAWKNAWFIAAMGVAAWSLSACESEAEERRGVRNISSALTALESCDDVDNHVAEIITNRIIEANSYYSYNGGWGNGGWDNDMADGAPPPAMPEHGTDDGPQDFTETNLQEDGVDEADILKTNGTHMFVSDEGSVLVVKAWPVEDSEVLATIQARGTNPEMFLVGDDQLVVLSHVYNYDQRSPFYKYFPDQGGVALPPMEPEEDGCYDGCFNGSTKDQAAFNGVSIERWDIRDPSQPQAISAQILEGSYITSRVVDQRLYLIQSTSAENAGPLTAIVEQELKIGKRLNRLEGERRRAKLETLRPEIEERVRQHLSTIDYSARARYYVNDDPQTVQALVACDQIYVPDALSNTIQMVHIAALDLRDELPKPQAVALLSDGWLAYASANAAYIVRSSQFWSWRDNTADVVTSDIHRIDLEDGSPRYVASGRVEGFARDRFVMSEREGVFRIATTDQRNFWGVRSDSDVAIGAPALPPDVAVADRGANKLSLPPPAPSTQANNLFTLEEQDGKLVQIGEVRGFGMNEQIFGTRYVGDFAYVVTFRQTDPLYAIDLSDPRAPAVRGELKIPGFSNFLQSIGEGWLVGIGQDADEWGRITGFQVQLFDVRDPAKPLRTAQHLVSTDDWSSSHSSAESESRAFTWYPRLNQLSIPVQIWENSLAFNGLLVFKITPEDGIQEVGRMSHAELDGNPCSSDGYCYQGYATSIRRSAFIDDYLFALSSVGLSVSAVDALPDFLFTTTF